tara:strand:+ start:380 stop:667 length:288 start_codon:yes stop_codon:yes gene_type:complete
MKELEIKNQTIKNQEELINSLKESIINLKDIIDINEKQLILSGVGNWVMCNNKLPLDHENYLVEGDGQYAVTFYSVRRKNWHVDFKVSKYKDIPK